MSKVQQLALWDEPVPIVHHHIEVHFAGPDGGRAVLCNANPKDVEAFKRASVYAGYVGDYIDGECSICARKEKVL